MKHRTNKTLVLALLAGAFAFGGSTIALERDAHACGGCFNPPETPTVVSDHRMILTVSKTQSTLYDQIRYTGAPSSFAWVLPISATVEVGLSADVMFSALDQMTQTQILPPPRNCPPRPNDCDDSPNRASSAPSDSEEGGGVNVLKREVVGPYETVQLQASNPTALRDWLAANGFNVPDDVKPVVDKYVEEKFNFLALRLVPGKDTQDMRPVRVTTQGANVALPLRMVAAGTGPQVGISLWVVGEGRYQPQNFASFIIASEDISWDWTQNKSNYVELRTQRNADGAGRTWEVESSLDLNRNQLENIVRQGTFNGSGPFPQNDDERAATDYLPVQDPQGTTTKTAAQVRDEDLGTLFSGIVSNPRVTRMRADLVHAALDADLLMTATPDQSVLSNTRQVTKELNQPLCPVWKGCSSTGQAPRDQAISQSSTSADGGETFTCGTSVKRQSQKSWFWAGFAAIGAAELIRRARTRQRGKQDSSDTKE